MQSYTVLAAIMQPANASWLQVAGSTRFGMTLHCQLKGGCMIWPQPVRLSCGTCPSGTEGGLRGGEGWRRLVGGHGERWGCAWNTSGAARTLGNGYGGSILPALVGAVRGGLWMSLGEGKAWAFLDPTSQEREYGLTAVVLECDLSQPPHQAWGMLLSRGG